MSYRTVGGILLGFLSYLLMPATQAGETPTVEYVYRGNWQTVNRPLDGEMTCIVTSTGKHKWQGRFYGIWQGVDFDYTVDFTGPPKDLQGSAMIDGASYDWRAWITRDAMKANFSGSRYEGSFDLKRLSTADVARMPPRPESPATQR